MWLLRCGYTLIFASLTCIGVLTVGAQTTNGKFGAGPVLSTISIDSNDSNQTVFIDETMAKSVLFYGVISVVGTGANKVEDDALGVNRQCVSELRTILNGINKRKLWAIKALDSSGSTQSSFIWGNKAWPGSPKQCDWLNSAPAFSLTPSIPKTMHENLISTTTSIPMEFRMVFSKFETPNQVDPIFNLKSFNRLGLCLPATCTDADIYYITQRYWSSGQSNFMKLYDIHADVIQVRSLNMSNFTHNPTVIWITSITTVAILLVIIFNIIGVLVPVSHKAHDFFECFSIRQSVIALFDVSDTTSPTSCINGIRPIICVWIIVVHVAYYSMFLYDNLQELFQALNGFAIQSMFTAFFYVDVFFVLGGLLLTYNFLKDETKINDLREASISTIAKKYGKLILHRYIRFTPALMFTIALSQILSLYIKDASPHYIDEDYDLFTTSSGFWHSLLYIQNLYSVADMSLTWSWYLASDMQFYTIILLLLFVYTRHPKIASTIFLTLLASIMAISFYIILDAKVTPRIDSLFANIDVYYTPPWMRVHPYLAGVIVGYVMVRLQSIKLKLSQTIVGLYWFIVSIVLSASLFVTYNKEISPVIFAGAFSVGRLFLSLFWGSIVAMCFLGYGGGLQRILGSRLLSHLNKTSYMMYLLNPVIITLFKSTQESSDHYDFPSMVGQVFGVVMMTYVAAVVTTPLLEAPFQRISDRYVMKRFTKKTPTEAISN